MADTGFGNYSLTETDVANELANGNFQWSPTPNVYNGVSPEAPEPASLSMFLIGAGTFFGLGVWRRTALAVVS